ncbi:MAG: NUDIX domain-containing protein [Candidatus Saccharibacteria bacterium]|nr:NUDIX domain-containing protein [Candidatus Saccharibacteria bacterium]
MCESSPKYTPYPASGAKHKLYEKEAEMSLFVVLGYDIYMKLSSEVLRKHKGVSFTGVGTVFICHDGNGKFLMSKRSANTRDEKGRWETPGGGLKWGFTAEDNIRREVKEELCADTQAIEFIGYRDVFREKEDGTKTHWLMLDFAVLVDPKQVKIGEPEQCDEIGWFTLTNQPTPLHSQHKKLLEKYNEHFRHLGIK